MLTKYDIFLVNLLLLKRFIVKRFQDLLPKCPRKMTFENVMKMISESLRFQEIGVDF